ncbi:hypothetical protein CBP51_02285 [Cellvibrio mixtus]|uniref:Uncharacterized protein n=1 Tax=Cellvibrio mixtus TaxID=39650 RepID=A0A266Q8D5_9GAMM|nr:hypothetical protein [Cellvibrio mixtus]OZY85886.1 hypothetical protein CBP51_02285 [Cellvibrio mixtus]
MRSDDSETKSKLLVILKDVDPNYKNPERRNELVKPEKYDSIDQVAIDSIRIGTNGVAYVPESAFSGLFQLSKAKAAYVYENQIRDDEKRSSGGVNYAHSSAVVGLLDKKAQEVRSSDTQALLQYARDTIINISDSTQAQDLRRKCDTLTARVLPTLRRERGVTVDELDDVTPLGPCAAFHHTNPKEIHTDPEDVVNPDKGRNLNKDSHTEVHREQINDEQQFEQYKKARKPT